MTLWYSITWWDNFDKGMALTKDDFSAKNYYHHHSGESTGRLEGRSAVTLEPLETDLG